MSENNNQMKEFALESAITTSIQIPGVKVVREKFLAEAFASEEVDLTELIACGPIVYGISRDKLSSIANKLILKRTSQSSAASFVAGIPGGLAMAATIPADVLQFFGMALRLAQELSYLYGAKSLWDDGKVDEEKVRSQLILYCGVMFGVSGAVSGVRVLTTQIAKVTAKKLPQKALTKTFWYPIVKQIGKAVGIKITKTSLAKGVSKIVPVLGGVISGTLNFASMIPMANRLLTALDESVFDYTQEELDADIIAMENVEEEVEGTVTEDAEQEEKGDLTETVTDGVKNIGAGISNLFNKRKEKEASKKGMEKLKQLKELLDSGIITEEEFNQKKKEILDII